MSTENPEPEDNPFPSMTIGMVVYNSKKYLPYCLESLKKQSFRNFQIVIQDNTEGKSGDSQWIRENYPDITVIESKNVGFAKAHNNLIRNTQSNYYLAANPDMIFEEDFLEKLFQAVDEDSMVGSVTGKILRWEFEKVTERNTGKTDVIDSTGLRFLRNHRFEDRGQGEKDAGQYDKKTNIFGVSGAAALYRRDALDEVAFVQKDGTREYFDELMYMYKEDIDLAYRLQWAGYKSVYVPGAVCYHDRTAERVGGKNSFLSILRSRRGRDKSVKKWSYLNQKILVAKNLDRKFSRVTRNKTHWNQILTDAYVLVLEPYLLGEKRKFRKLKKDIRERRAQIKRHISPKDLEKMME